MLVPRDNQNHIPKKQNLYTRETKSFDNLGFIADYLSIDWNTALERNNNDVNNSLQIFLTKINDLLDIYMPLRKVSQKEYKKRFKPWITDRVLSKINEKNQALEDLINNNNPITKEQLNWNFKTLKTK